MDTGDTGPLDRLIAEILRGEEEDRGLARAEAAARAARGARDLAAAAAADDAALLARLGPDLHRALDPMPGGDDTYRLRARHRGTTVLLARGRDVLARGRDDTWYIRAEEDLEHYDRVLPGKDLGRAIAAAFAREEARAREEAARAAALDLGARLVGAARDALWAWPPGPDGRPLPLRLWSVSWRTGTGGRGKDNGYALQRRLGPGGALRTLPGRRAEARSLRLLPAHLPAFERLIIRGPDALPDDLRDPWTLRVPGIRRDPDALDPLTPAYVACDDPGAAGTVAGPLAPPAWGRARLDTLAAARAAGTGRPWHGKIAPGTAR